MSSKSHDMAHILLECGHIVVYRKPWPQPNTYGWCVTCEDAKLATDQAEGFKSESPEPASGYARELTSTPYIGSALLTGLHYCPTIRIPRNKNQQG